MFRARQAEGVGAKPVVKKIDGPAIKPSSGEATKIMGSRAIRARKKKKTRSRGQLGTVDSLSLWCPSHSAAEAQIKPRPGRGSEALAARRRPPANSVIAPPIAPGLISGTSKPPPASRDAGRTREEQGDGPANRQARVAPTTRFRTLNRMT